MWLCCFRLMQSLWQRQTSDKEQKHTFWKENAEQRWTLLLLERIGRELPVSRLQMNLGSCAECACVSWLAFLAGFSIFTRECFSSALMTARGLPGCDGQTPLPHSSLSS